MRNQSGKATRLERRLGAQSVRRPTAAGGEFDLRYLRTGPFPDTPSGAAPSVVIPGGPGLAATLPYVWLRKWATKNHVDLIMLEHRGVGLSRRDTEGADLSADDMWMRLVVEDIATVLEAEGIERAVVYGSSYGSYVALSFAAEHPDRLAALVLDSALLSAHDHVHVREASRAALLDGRNPDTAHVTTQLNALVADGLVTREAADAVTRIVYEFAGPVALERLLDQVRAGKRLVWGRVEALQGNDTQRVVPFVMEFDIVGTIAFRELNYAPEPDGLPFDPGASFAQDALRFPPFGGEPYNHEETVRSLDVPVVVLSGNRDLRTPQVVAERIVATAARGHLIPLPNGHSVLDTHRPATKLVFSALAAGGATALIEREGEIRDVAGGASVVSLSTLINAGLRLGALLPR